MHWKACTPPSPTQLTIGARVSVGSGLGRVASGACALTPRVCSHDRSWRGIQCRFRVESHNRLCCRFYIHDAGKKAWPVTSLTWNLLGFCVGQQWNPRLYLYNLRLKSAQNFRRKFFGYSALDFEHMLIFILRLVRLNPAASGLLQVWMRISPIWMVFEY